MLRRHYRFFQSLQIMVDVAGVGLAFILAFQLRFALPQLFPYQAVSTAAETRTVGLWLALTWPLVGWLGGLYVSRRTHSSLSEVGEVLRTTVAAFMVVVTLTYFFRDVRYSRGVLLLWAGCTAGLLSVLRAGLRLLLQHLRQRGFNLRHVVIIGDGALAQRVLATLRAQARFGLRPLGFISLEAPPVPPPAGLPMLGRVAELAELLIQYPVDQVIVALPLAQMTALRGIMEVLSRETVEVRLIPDLDQVITLCGGLEEFGGMPMIHLQATPLVGWNRVIKRAFDLVAGSLALLLLAPLLGLLGVLVRLDSRGPILFRQERVGMDGRHFMMLKLRTMRADAEVEGARWAVAGDSRCTRLGRTLRRLSLDELPQLLNVLAGHMSLVGPRPERPCFIAAFKQDIPRYALRHKIKAGMTGWAQVHGLRGNTSLTQRLELDLYYIENWSLLLDLRILLRTLCGGFLSRNAY